jgi:hypothetical protein
VSFLTILSFPDFAGKQKKDRLLRQNFILTDATGPSYCRQAVKFTLGSSVVLQAAVTACNVDVRNSANLAPNNKSDTYCLLSARRANVL